jgi:hypothetical protein
MGNKSALYPMDFLLYSPVTSIVPKPSSRPKTMVAWYYASGMFTV